MKRYEYSVAAIEEKLGSFGIPHFQRGSVWDSEDRAKLLESFFYDTPCGSILLWQPDNPAEYGTKLNNTPEQSIQSLIIDGQQRILTIASLFRDESSEKRTWCLNLYHIKELIPLLKKGKELSEKPMFLYTKDPSLNTTEKRSNMLNIDLLLKSNWDPYEDSMIIENLKTHKFSVDLEEGIKKEDIIQTIMQLQLKSKLAAIKSRMFPVYIYDNNTLVEIVNIYNRINSAGIRVESEEKAFATLTSVWSGTNKWIKDLFENIHDKKEGSNGRYYLKRQQEKMLGFKFFIRCLVQASSYHYNASIGSSGFSFDVVHRNSFKDRLVNNQKDCERLFEQTKIIIQQIRDIIQYELKIDDFRFLPDTYQLQPLVQFMSKYHEENEEKRKESFYIFKHKYASIALKLLMFPDETRGSILTMCNNINSNIYHDLKKALIALDKKIDELIGQDRKTKIKKYIQDADSLNHRYILLLYGLERLHGAKDFSPKNRSVNDRSEAQSISASLACERQHLIPYSLLKRLKSLPKRRGRENKHIFNNIGNISYISNKLNWDIGEKLLDFHFEDKNLSAHFLNDEIIQQKYAMFPRLNALDDNERKRYIKEKATHLYNNFEEFSNRRRAILQDAFNDWIVSFEDKSKTNKDIRVEPLGRFFSAPDIEKYIHQFDSDLLNEYIEDTLVDQIILLKEKKIEYKLAMKKGEADGIEIITHKEKRRQWYIKLSINVKRIKFDFSKDITNTDELFLSRYPEHLMVLNKKVIRMLIEEQTLDKAKVLIQNVFESIISNHQK